jgi:hypothetical protein
MSPLIGELLRLEAGVNINIKNEMKRDIKFFCVNGVYDKPARASILCMHAFNGSHGCLKCTQDGTSIQSKKGYQ